MKKMGWVVYKIESPLGFSFRTFLSVPRRKGKYFSSVEVWDEEHDALVFDSFWKAAWQGIRHFALVRRNRTEPTML